MSRWCCTYMVGTDSRSDRTVTVSRTDGGRRFGSGRVVPRRVVKKKKAHVYMLCVVSTTGPFCFRRIPKEVAARRL